MKPSDFIIYPWSSILKNCESETIAANIMVILSRTGNTFREITFDEYKIERTKDGNFTNGEKAYFDRVINYCTDPKSASLFCESWAKKFKELQ